MDSIKSAVIAVCAVSAARCMIGNIGEASRLKGQLMMLIDLLLGMVIIAPFATGCTNIELPRLSDYELTDYSGYGYIYDTAILQETSANISAVLADQLTAANIPFENITTDVNISADGSIFINRVTVITSSPEKAAELIRNSLGNDVNVVCTGGEDNGNT